jgi:Tol biopolymer transport system component
VWSEKPLLISSSFKYVVDWSRDGTSVLFNQQDGASPVSSLWVLSTREQVPTQYLRTGFHLERARLSPDSRWVAYDSDESGRAEVYVQTYPDPGTRYQVSVAGGTRPRWATNGRELFYVAAAGTIMAAPIQLGRSNAIGTAKALFSLSAKDDSDLEYEVAPDGQRLLITTVIRPPVRSPITVVMNWSAGLTK